MPEVKARAPDPVIPAWSRMMILGEKLAAAVGQLGESGGTRRAARVLELTLAARTRAALLLRGAWAALEVTLSGQAGVGPLSRRVRPAGGSDP